MAAGLGMDWVSAQYGRRHGIERGKGLSAKRRHAVSCVPRRDGIGRRMPVVGAY
jgi:hypothetical protein